MTEPFRGMAELRALLNSLCEETITAEQTRRLEELIRNHPEAEAHYVQYVSLYADLIRQFAAPSEQALRGRIAGAEEARERGGVQSEERKRELPVSPAPALPRSLASSRRFAWGALAGLAAGLLLALVLKNRPKGDPFLPSAAAEETDETVAVLLQAPGAEWEEPAPPQRAGAPLLPGWLRLKSGFARLEFYSGATVVLEGPAEFQLISRIEAYCARGKLRAIVPPQAQGFTIGTPKLELVDRGTEFGLQVGAGDKTEVHVFQGKVELHDAGSARQAPAPKELTTGQGVRLDDPGTVRPITSDPGAFRTVQDLEERRADEVRRQQRAWLAGSEVLRRDPSLLVHYTFEDEPAGSRTLRDQAGGRRQPHDGAIVGCRWSDGRWPGKKGLEFKQVSDRVRFHVPGEWDALTLLAWVRVDGLRDGNNALMMCDGWGPGGCHWQIGERGKLVLGVQERPKGRGGHYHALDAFTAKRLGQWVQLAVTCDRKTGQVIHYVDGQPAPRQHVERAIAFNVPLSIGDAELGNWSVGSLKSSSPIRYFSGCMDEFMLFSRALSGPEIERLYEQGRPPL